MDYVWHKRRMRRLRRPSLAVSLVDSVVSAADQQTYVFSGRTLGAGLIVIAGTWRAAAAITLSSVVIAGKTATIDVSSVNGQTGSFIAHAEVSAVTGDVEVTLSASSARAGIAIYHAAHYGQAAAYLTATASRANSAGTMAPNLVGEISAGFVVGAAMNGLGPGHRIGAAHRVVTAQTNYNVTADAQSGNTIWTGLDEGVDTQMEATGTNVDMAACTAAFR